MEASRPSRPLAQAGWHHKNSSVWLASGGTGNRGQRPAYRQVSLAAASVAEKLLGIPYPVPGPSAWRTIFREAARADVILVHDALYITSIAGYLAARAHRKPLVVVQHVGFVPYKSALLRTLMQGANRCIAAPLLGSADRVIFISELTMRQFAHVCWRRPPALIFNGVDTDVFSPALASEEIAQARARFGLPATGSVALFVGRFVEKKGLRALEHMARLRSDVLFVFAGNGRSIRGTGDCPTCAFTPACPGQLAPLYRASDLLLLPSAGEGFPLVIQEALACGLPIICGIDTACADAHAAPFIERSRWILRIRSERLPVLRGDDTCAGSSGRRPTGLPDCFAKANYSWTVSGAPYAEILRGLCARPSGLMAIRPVLSMRLRKRESRKYSSTAFLAPAQ